MEAFISEPLRPLKGPRDTTAMARGEPGLPSGFRWRDADYTITQRLESWKESAPEGHRAGNEVYLRRHCYRLVMDSGDTWRVYFTRQPLRGKAPRARWFLYTIESQGHAAADDDPENPTSGEPDPAR